MEVIKVENLSKLYDLGQVGTGTISKDLNRWWARARGKDDPSSKIGHVNDRTKKAGKDDSVWALKDINFSVKQGEVVGIIGRNGAGKSTLLKIISRITTPTTGAVKVKGRIASLLEVGTGFHPEMTGRENIFMNGTLLGMTRREIQNKLDEIIDFAGVAMYIDTPVKRYSSGMQVRLAFAVAAFLEPEILIVDEVLAVGDVEFQKKALGRMQAVSRNDGRTVLFVSHNMAAVKSLCKTGIVLANGTVDYVGTSELSVQHYITRGTEYSNYQYFKDIYKSDTFNLISIKAVAMGKDIDTPLDENDQITIETKIEIFKEPERYHFTYVLTNHSGEPIFTFTHKGQVKLRHGLNILSCELPKGFLNIDSYHLSSYLIKDSKETEFMERDIIAFNVIEGERGLGAWMGREPGFIKPQFKWTQH